MLTPDQLMAWAEPIVKGRGATDKALYLFLRHFLRVNKHKLQHQLEDINIYGFSAIDEKGNRVDPSSFFAQKE